MTKFKYFAIAYFIYFSFIFCAGYLDMGWNFPVWYGMTFSEFIDPVLPVNIRFLMPVWGYIPALCILVFLGVDSDVPILYDMKKMKTIAMITIVPIICLLAIEYRTGKVLLTGTWGSWETIILYLTFMALASEILLHKSIASSHKFILLPCTFFSMIYVFELPYQVLLTYFDYIPLNFLTNWLTVSAMGWAGTIFIIYLIVFSKRFGYSYKLPKTFLGLGIVFVLQWIARIVVGYQMYPNMGIITRVETLSFHIELVWHFYTRFCKVIVGLAHLEVLKGFG